MTAIAALIGAASGAAAGIAAQPAAPQATVAPAIPGDFADPSLIRAGSEYWAVATSGSWAPVFPIMHSRDLVSWSQAGAVFDRPPAWTDGSYWAPQLVAHDNRFLLYYAAHHRGGHQCVAVAVARAPVGPYHDRGPLRCGRRGSIDPMLFVDPAGASYLLWKQMGRGAPLWIQRTTPNGTALTGRATRILAPDRPWERGVTENPYLVFHDGQYVLFYSGGTCCRLPCSYAIGVARAPSPIGPYTKDPANPIVHGDQTWRCPGGASAFDDASGMQRLVYHAHQRSAEYLGRQALLATYTWGPDGWPVVAPPTASTASTPPAAQPASSDPQPGYVEDFAGPALAPGWLWPFDRRPRFRLIRGELRLVDGVPGDELASFVGLQPRMQSYTAMVAVDRNAVTPGALAGVAIDGGVTSTVGVGVRDNKVIVWQHSSRGDRRLVHQVIPSWPTLWLRVRVTDGSGLSLSLSPDGATWTGIGTRGIALPEPPNDQVVLLTVSGRRGAAARFSHVRLIPGS